MPWITFIPPELPARPGISQRIDTPQISYPFEILQSGKVREVEQDTLDEIGMSVEIILRYQTGTRDELPEFGVPDILFTESNEDLSGVLAEHVSRWETRAPVFIEERPGDWDTMVRHFTARIEGSS